MAERYLPIQFFEKRKDFDDRSTEGGGDTRIPSWVLSGEALISRSTQLTESISDLSAVFAERKRQGESHACAQFQNLFRCGKSRLPDHQILPG